MTAKTYEAGYSKYYGDRLKNVLKSTSEEEIKQLYRDWASSYDEVRKTFWCKPAEITGSISNDDGDGTENGRNAIGLISKTTTLPVYHIFSTDFFAVISKNQFVGQVFFTL